MSIKVFACVREHRAASFALGVALSAACFAAVFALNELAFADSDEDTKIVSGRIQTDPVDWTNGDPPGPLVLTAPGFGELFVAQCRGDDSVPEFGI